MWETCFDKPIWWKQVYTQKILNIPIRKIADFNFKLVHNILPSSALVSRWNSKVTCKNCNVLDDTEHMLYNCNLVKDIWSISSFFSNIQLKWNHLSVGYKTFFEGNIIYDINLFISIICYAIFKYSMTCKCNNKIQSGTGVKHAVANDIKKHILSQKYLKRPYISTYLCKLMTKVAKRLVNNSY